MPPVTCMIKIKKPQKNLAADDDGRTIAPMNVPGMPWHHRPHLGKRRSRPADEAEQGPVTPLSGKETRRLILQAVLTALVIGLIFLAAIFLFILFSLKVWLR